MKHYFFTTLLNILLSSTSLAYMKMNDFTEVKTTTTESKIQCEEIYNTENNLLLLAKEHNFLGERLDTEIKNNNPQAQEQIKKLQANNLKRQSQALLKLTSLKNTPVNVEKYLSFSGVSKFLLKTSATPYNAASGTVTSLLKSVKSPVSYELSYSWEDPEKDKLGIDRSFNKVIFNMTQEQFCFSDEINLGVTIEFEVEHIYAEERIVTSHHIGFDLSKARSEKRQIENQQTRENVIATFVEPVMAEIFGLSNFYLINDRYLENLTRVMIEKNTVFRQGQMQALKDGFTKAKTTFHSTNQIDNFDLKTRLKQSETYKVYENGLIGAVLKNGPNTIEVLFGNDPVGVFVERLLVNGEIVYATKIDPPFGIIFDSTLKPDPCPLGPANPFCKSKAVKIPKFDVCLGQNGGILCPKLPTK